MRFTVLLLALASAFTFAAENAAVAPQSAANPQSTIDNRQSTIVSGAEAITIPQMLSYQGKLTDSLGQPVPDGNYQLTFRLYTQPTGGSAIWTEGQTMQVVDGLFSALLGSVTPISSVPDGGALYLGLQVAVAPELAPRLRIVSAAYAFLTARAANADLLQGRDTAAFAPAGHNHDATYVNEGQADAVTGAMLVDGTVLTADVGDTAVTMAKLARTGATTGQVVKWTGSAWAPSQDNTGGGSGVTDVYQDTGIICVPNPITSSGNVKLNLSYSDGRYINTAGDSMTGALAVQGDLRVYGKGRIGPSNSNAGTGAFVVGQGNSASGAYSSVTGGEDNSVGSSHSHIGGGSENKVDGDYASVGGGEMNHAAGAKSAIAGGVDNQAVGVYSTVGAGRSNTAGDAAGDTCATVAGGHGNLAMAMFATVGGGQNDTASGVRATVAGGGRNRASGGNATVGGGWNNAASGNEATVGGGQGNTATDWCAVVGGGDYNSAAGSRATVAGGAGNGALGLFASSGGGSDNSAGDAETDTAATVAGGYYNVATGKFSTVGGGQNDTASGGYTAVGGGKGNAASVYYALVGGGLNNKASGFAAAVGGGQSNTATGSEATVGGGLRNDATGDQATVGGGEGNDAPGRYAAIGGGYEADAIGTYSVVGGGYFNHADTSYATVGGGQSNGATGYGSTVSGGRSNQADGEDAAVGGGLSNEATGDYAAVGGGFDNSAGGFGATVAGGRSNDADTNYAAIGGGYDNTASAAHATVPGGGYNAARGSYSLAAGRYARANHRGSFVWSDSAASASESVYTTDNNQFRARARGGTWFFSNAGMTTGAYLAPGSNSWESACDSMTKEDFQPVDRKALLDKVAALRVRNYKMKDQNDGTRHIGPVAQDFHNSFGYGGTETSINLADADGVLLAAVQALYDEMKVVRELNAAQQAEIEVLKSELKRR
jgi:hypothetical protein